MATTMEQRRVLQKAIEGNAAEADGVAATPARESSAPSKDLLLVRRLLAGDEGAFASIVDHYNDTLTRLALLFVPSRAVAEEVVQETWVAVIDGLGRFEGRSTFKTWLFRILINRAKTRGVREGKYVAMAEGDSEAPAADESRFRSDGSWAEPPKRWDADTPERLLMRKEALGELEAALAALPVSQRAVVVLRDIEGLSSNVACSILEITETNQRVLLHRARTQIRGALRDYVGRM